jgi:SAM-dependent methyltransferase
MAYSPARPTVRSLLRPLRRLARRLIGPRPDRRPPIQQWHDRAREHGVRAVFNLGHGPEEMARVTEGQRAVLLPLLRARLRGDERMVLDLGCGPGRFTPALADLTHARVIGMDPIPRLLELAPRHSDVEYRVMSEAQIPLPSSSVDVAWICLVLGGVHGLTLERTVAEVRRVLRPGGLVFLVENTNDAPGDAFWAFRSVAEYQRLFLPVRLEHVHDYDDLGERISVLTGRA